MLSEDLWNSVSDVIRSIRSHPFLLELRRGDLDETKFRFYIVQDHLYLSEFAKALLLAAVKSENMEQFQMFLRHVQGILETERQLHLYFLSMWKPKPEEFEMSPTNLAYTNFLLKVASEEPYHRIIGAVLPCYWIYMEVGKWLSISGSPHPLYDKWIRTYGGEAFERSVREVISIADSLELTEGQRRETKDYFRLASIYEYMFWDSAYKLERFPFRVRT